MKLREIIPLIDGRLISEKASLDVEVDYGAAADLMSDVLAFAKTNAVILTGLINSQVIRTAEMADAAAVVFVRGKLPAEETVRLAEEMGIPLIACKYSMFEACGKLYMCGLRGSDPLPPSNGDW
jgi:predicted transcriptional regulator